MTRKTPANQTTPATTENEGEGSRTAARNYNQKTRAFIDAGKVDEAAEAAKEALEGDERDELADAEQRGKSRARS